VHATEPPQGEQAPVLRLVTDNSRAGSARAGIVELYHLEFRSMARLAYLLCGDMQQADDLTHDAFVRLYEHWDRVADPSRRVGYLRSIVVNLAHSAHRREATARRHVTQSVLAAGGGTTSSTSAEDEAIWRSARPDVMAALAALPDRQRTAVVLRHWLRMTETEIAEAMGCSVGSVRTHVARGHQTLAQRLGGIR